MAVLLLRRRLTYGVVERHRVDDIVVRKVVAVGRIVSMPSNDIERRVILLLLEELSAKLSDDRVRDVLVFERGGGSLEIAGVGETVCALHGQVEPFMN